MFASDIVVHKHEHGIHNICIFDKMILYKSFGTRTLIKDLHIKCPHCAGHIPELFRVKNHIAVIFPTPEEVEVKEGTRVTSVTVLVYVYRYTRILFMKKVCDKFLCLSPMR